MLDNNGGFENYIETSMDPGNSMVLATVIFCVLLISILPCVVSLGRRFQVHEDVVETDSGESSQDKVNGGHLNGGLPDEHRIRPDKRPVALYGNRQRSSDEEDNESVYSARSTASRVGSVASALVNAILDTAPHGNVWKRKANIDMYANDPDAMEFNQAIDNSDAKSVDHSILSRISHDEVSIADAIDAPESIQPKGDFSEVMHDGSCRSRLRGNFDKLLAIAEWDYETKRICRLGGPFVVQALTEGVLEAVRVAVIGRLIGTRAVTAYVTVDLVVGLTTSFLQGFQHACTTLCSHAVGSGNRKLAGQYIQIATILFALCYIPIFIFWTLYIGTLLTWFDFDEETVKIGEDFTKLFLFSSFLEGVHDSAHSLLDVIGKEKYSTFFIMCQEVASVGFVFAIGLKSGTTTLELVGLSYIASEALGLVVNTAVIVGNGWFDRYLEGLVGSFALFNKAATKLLLTTSVSLSFGELLAYGEWELLTVFASVLGPAEIAAWGLLGTLWDALELVTEAVADAAEVRTAFLLGAGQPEKAKMSAYKSIYMGVFVSIFLSSLLFIGGDDVATWLTTDATLQRMTTELMPLFGIGNIALTIGTMSWTLVGAQGRYRLATAVGFSGSWFVSIPLSAILTVALNMDLQGQTAAVVIGYMVSGTLNSYVLFQSDWPKLSRRVMEQAEAARPVDSDDSSSSSSDSSSSEASPALVTNMSEVVDEVVTPEKAEEAHFEKYRDVPTPEKSGEVQSSKKENAALRGSIYEKLENEVNLSELSAQLKSRSVGLASPTQSKDKSCESSPLSSDGILNCQNDLFTEGCTDAFGKMSESISTMLPSSASTEFSKASNPMTRK